MISPYLLLRGLSPCQYSWHSGVLHTTTCQLERSKVARVEPEQQLLEQVGASVLIVHLHGMLFFGSATSVEEKVRAHMRQLAQLELPFNALLLDFDRVSAIDSSAVASLMQTRRYIGSAQLLFACASPEALTMLRRGAPPSVAFEHFTTIDLALEYAERRPHAALYRLVALLTFAGLEPHPRSQVRGGCAAQAAQPAERRPPVARFPSRAPPHGRPAPAHRGARGAVRGLGRVLSSGRRLRRCGHAAALCIHRRHRLRRRHLRVGRRRRAPRAAPGLPRLAASGRAAARRDLRRAANGPVGGTGGVHAAGGARAADAVQAG